MQVKINRTLRSKKIMVPKNEYQDTGKKDQQQQQHRCKKQDQSDLFCLIHG